jgi:uridylate kinase
MAKIEDMVDDIAESLPETRAGGRARYKRILVKASGEALQGAGYGIDPAVLKAVAEDLREVVELGVQVAVVIGGGNIFRGVSTAAAGMNRARADDMGMLATVINALALQDALEQHGVAARTLSAIHMTKVCDDFAQRRALELLERGEVILLAAGTGNPYFTTDTAGVLRGLEIGADVVLKATKVDGVYDKDPVLHSDARRFDSLSFSEVLRRGLRIMDHTAISLCRENALPIVVFDMLTRGNMRRVVCGEPVGTIVGPEEESKDAQ